MLWTLASDVVDPANPLTWINLGVAGLFIWSGVRGFVWLKPAVDQLRKDLEELRSENRTLNAFLREAIVPAITESNSLSRSSTEALNDATELMRLLTAELKRRPRGQT